jgi:hypothetical protein
MSISISLTRIPEGTVVADTSGEPIGKVIEAHPDHLVVEHGRFFPDDLEIPRDAVAGIDDSRVLLNMSIEEVARRHWPRNGTPG